MSVFKKNLKKSLKRVPFLKKRPSARKLCLEFLRYTSFAGFMFCCLSVALYFQKNAVQKIELSAAYVLHAPYPPFKQIIARIKWPTPQILCQNYHLPQEFDGCVRNTHVQQYAMILMNERDCIMQLRLTGLQHNDELEKNLCILQKLQNVKSPRIEKTITVAPHSPRPPKPQHTI